MVSEDASTDLESPFLVAMALGALEGFTEFLPVSSTGHLILAVDLLRLELLPGRVFEVAIQSGAILAVCVLFFSRLRRVMSGAVHDPGSRAFLRNILLTSIPAGVLGMAFHEVILSVLFDARVVAIALVVGGVVMLVAERLQTRVRFREVEDISPGAALAIGGAQCLALIPGVSRSAATIIGGLLVGVERRTAAEFSFFAALPVLFGAAAIQIFKNAEDLAARDGLVLGLGTLTAFVFATLAIHAGHRHPRRVRPLRGVSHPAGCDSADFRPVTTLVHHIALSSRGA